MDKNSIRIAKDFIKKVRRKYKLEKAIFFGSRVRGDNFRTSDFDFILVSRDFKNIFFTDRISDMYKFWGHFPIDVEPLCYTPEEFERKKKEIGIVRQAIKEGIEL